MVPGRILIVDDDPVARRILESALGSAGFGTQSCGSAEDAIRLLEESDVDVLLTDLNLGGMSGIDLCDRVAKSRPDLPVILVTVSGKLESAVSAIRAGAYDFITKPVQAESVLIAVNRALQHRAMRDEVRRLRRAAAQSDRFEELVGNSPSMQSVYDLMGRVADSEATVLVTGESGTGKELVARALHRRSRRASGPFVAVNCAALSESLLESELFGHTRGAFTDARREHPGLFVRASGGTLFLDEVGDMPPPLQVKLLRALQERSVRPVGGTDEVPFDVRLVAATNQDLDALVAERRFRQDLFFRLNVIRVELPPLRGRGNDVLLLAQHMIDAIRDRTGKLVTGLSPAAAERLLSYDWPGNVRELSNCIERAMALARVENVAVEDLPDAVRNHRARLVLPHGDDPDELVPLAEVERRYILRVLDVVGGNRSVASRILGLDRTTLYRKLLRYGMDDEAPSSSRS